LSSGPSMPRFERGGCAAMGQPACAAPHRPMC
jgi:hypothetical protein